MRRKLVVACAAVSAAILGGSACAVTRPSAADARCSVEGADRLPADVGGEAAVCAEVARAMAEAGAGAASVVVTVRSPYELAAAVTDSAGTTHPEIRFNKSDRPLSHGSIQRFARNVAEAAVTKR